jgi:exopolysaccharide biosynthesis protein
MLSSKNPLQLVFAKYRRLVSLLSVFCVLCGQSLAQDWKTVHDGVEYAQVEKEISGLKVKMNLLRLDLKRVRLDVHHALDKAIGLETTSSIATRHGGVAAINSGFFRLDKSEFAGDAAGVLVIDRRLLSESTNNRVAVGIINRKRQTEVYFGHNDLDIDLRRDKFSGAQVDGINRQRKNDEVIVYTPEFGKKTPDEKSAFELIVRKNKVIAVQKGGNNEIPKDGFVVSAEDESPLDQLTVGSKIKAVKITSTAMYDFQPDIEKEKQRVAQLLMFERSVLFQLEDVTNGVPQLIRNGKIDITWEQEKTTKSFVETRHPRTAVAKLKDGKFLMITVDGRSELSGGLILYDLADYLLSIGAVDAMNLDGGGSTTMFLDGKVVNTPSDKEGERKVGDAIVVTLRNPRKR